MVIINYFSCGTSSLLAYWITVMLLYEEWGSLKSISRKMHHYLRNTDWWLMTTFQRATLGWFPKTKLMLLTNHCGTCPPSCFSSPKARKKVRVVFDCAARFSDMSLNDQLIQGPNLTNNLTGVLLRFRQAPVVLMLDIEQMFRQVLVAPDDCHALCFLCWKHSNMFKDLVDHQILAHLFGTTSSPSCPRFALRKSAHDHQSEFDVETVDTVNPNFYVDDCLKLVSTVPEAKRLVR